MSRIAAPRGTQDVLPADSPRWHAVENIARQVAAIYHFAEIRTPIYELSDLFHRGVGQSTDIVQKETFTFRPRPESESITLRPEGTAGVVRAAIENNLLAQEGARLKVYYLGPNFRYERPQKGRLRQHHQFGVESFGSPLPQADVECILLQMEFYRRCGVKDLSLQINSLGDTQSKARYRQVLLDFLGPRKASLSEDSQRRLDENPLRVLDSKDPRDQEACAAAPPALESLSPKSREHFERVQELLTTSAANFVVNPRLVRGFDYYTDTLWEVVAGGLGAQNALGGGGRYDNLVEELGGRPTPGVGFGSGIERLLLALEAQQVTLNTAASPLLWLVYHGPVAQAACWELLGQLRAANIACDMDYSGRSVKAQFKLADREKASRCIIIGDAELASGTILLKDLATGQQQSLPRRQLPGVLLEPAVPAQ